MSLTGVDQSAMDVPRARVRRRGRRAALVVALGVLAVGAATVALHRLRPAAPVIDRGAVWIDTVRRGPLVRAVQGHGELVPEEIRWISAVSPARVEQILVRPGTAVRAGTVLLVLANAEMELGALEAEQQVAAAVSTLVNLRATLDGQRLGQQSLLASLRSELEEARRRAAADEALAAKGFLSELERGQSRARVGELGGRLAFEEQRLAALERGQRAQVAAQEQQIERQRAVARVRRREVDDLGVRAGVDGVLQSLSLQVGQSVAAGTLLAKVARPDRLKAEIRIPEAQAKELRAGLPVSVDTHIAMVVGSVSRVDPAVQGGFVRVDVALPSPLPPGARPDLSVTATVELEHLTDVLYVGRPARAPANSDTWLLRLEPDGATAIRRPVTLGPASVKAVAVVRGLREGDRVILSDLAQWNDADRVTVR